jgi:hypothetical protein
MNTRKFWYFQLISLKRESYIKFKRALVFRDSDENCDIP